MDISKRTDWLFKAITKPDGREYSYGDVEEMADGMVTRTSIWKVRTGRTKNPGQKMLQALSTAFQVPANYFFDEGVTPEDIPNYRAQHRSEQMLEQIALRATDLDDEGKQAVLDMIDIVQKAREKSKE
jgi:transcriptional regulator with XRE-family HTH domain